ncbi:MAG: hypothetical protein U9P44_04075, partial [archaeon]|nr:hypothetical protein [archaeon]
LQEKYYLKFALCGNHFGAYTIEQLERNLCTGDHNERYIRFLASIKLNSFADKLEEKMYGILKNVDPELDKKIERAIAWNIEFATYESKQERHIDRLIAKKEEILNNGTEIIGYDRLRYYNYVPYLKELVLKELRF